MGWEEEEEGSLSEVLERLNFGTRFGEGCIGTSFSSLLSHLERFREGVEGPAPVGSIGTAGFRVDCREEDNVCRWPSCPPRTAKPGSFSESDVNLDRAFLSFSLDLGQSCSQQ